MSKESKIIEMLKTQNSLNEEFKSLLVNQSIAKPTKDRIINLMISFKNSLKSVDE